MRTRMEIIIIARQVIHSLQIVLKHLHRKVSDILLGSAEIHRVRCMCDQFTKMMLLHQCEQLIHICRINLLCLTATGIPCEKGKCVGTKL